MRQRLLTHDSSPIGMVDPVLNKKRLRNTLVKQKYFLSYLLSSPSGLLAGSCGYRWKSRCFVIHGIGRGREGAKGFIGVSGIILAHPVLSRRVGFMTCGTLLRVPPWL